MLTVKAFTFNPAQENTYVLYNERNKAIIIDPGCYFSAEQEKLKKFGPLAVYLSKALPEHRYFSSSSVAQGC